MYTNLFLNAKLFAISGLILGLTSSLLVLILVVYGRTKSHKIWALFNFSVAWWGFGSFFMGLADNASHTLSITKIAYIGVIFIPVFFYHFSCVFSEIDRRFLISFAYIQAIFFSFLSLSKNGIPFISHVERIGTSSMFYIRSTGLLYNISFFIWISLIVLGFIETVMRYLKEPTGTKRNQFMYLFVGFFLGFSGGLTNFLPVYNINLVPLGNFTIPVYCLIATYAILRYRILDIKVAVTRAGVFVVVYTLVLGIPFVLFFLGRSFLFNLVGEDWSIIPLITAVLLATVGPFIYLYLQRRAENILLHTQRQYQQALRDLSKSIVRLRNIEQLFDTITHQVVYSVKVSYAAMYFIDNQKKEFTLKSEYYNHKISFKRSLPKEISSSDPFIVYLQNAERSLILEEEKFKLNHSFFNIDAGLVIPCITKMGLTSIVFLGNKPNNQLYTEDDILTFDTLAAQAALAIENCQFAQELADKERVDRLQDMDAYSYSLAHEIDNPGQIILSGIGHLRTQIIPELVVPQETKDYIDKCLKDILEATRRITAMVQAIRSYGQTTTLELEPLKIEEVVESFSSLAQHRFKENSIIFTKELIGPLGFVRGQKPTLIQLLEIFASNSKDAMEYSTVKKVHLKVSQTNSDTIRIEFSDTGSGIEKNRLHLIFSPFVTTKASSQGTGMGLANAKKIVERHKGKIWAESEGKDKGATLIVELPVAKDITKEDFKKKEDKGKALF